MWVVGLRHEEAGEYAYGVTQLDVSLLNVACIACYRSHRCGLLILINRNFPRPLVLKFMGWADNSVSVRKNPESPQPISGGAAGNPPPYSVSANASR